MPPTDGPALIRLSNHSRPESETGALIGAWVQYTGNFKDLRWAYSICTSLINCPPLPYPNSRHISCREGFAFPSTGKRPVPYLFGQT